MIEEKFNLETQNWIDVTIISVSITLFALIAGLKSEILNSNVVFALQLVLTLPLIMSCIFIRSRLRSSIVREKWQSLSDFCFTLGYGFFINSVGILLSYFVPIYVVIIFFLVNILLAILRKYLRILDSKGKDVFGRVIRELIYITLMVVLGILPSLGNLR